MTFSHNERFLGLTVGVPLPKDQFKVIDIVIYQKTINHQFELFKQQPFVFDEASPRFTFCKENIYELLFLTKEMVFAYNFEIGGDNMRLIHKIDNILDKQPFQCIFSED